MPIHTEDCMYVRTGEHGCTCGGDERYAQAEMRADAKRYLYLKECTAGEWEEFNDLRLAGASLDAAIDAKLPAEGGNG